ncbi:hypothetical protein ASPZODRAFT_134923 [Penicilliopsis zonata CBS 506.65]|uniref:Uncharacterized protein n=1 Tax=Penicilliopsis zonata CBS 506.65 TaxID=1073090 RepID=A0A1L9SCE3_9EURO|nr:hypothetical protein ASPZODRAFT_134923 [Penicilliopsis zonata CBS 506.65]OJJ44788.1 hypothetical protein ASPZODRAFT_134923 [Penicilliopsis zonata CBS 506.65]
MVLQLLYNYSTTTLLPLYYYSTTTTLLPLLYHSTTLRDCTRSWRLYIFKPLSFANGVWLNSLAPALSPSLVFLSFNSIYLNTSTPYSLSNSP